jgi:cob(I)alamin adenosyltransferase
LRLFQNSVFEIAFGRRDMIHLYTGEGKGKTTAAMGMAIRAAGHGRKIVIVQFLKGKDSGELFSLDLLPTITVIRNREDCGFFGGGSENTLLKLTEENNENLKAALAAPHDLLVLDEICLAYGLEAVDREAVDDLLQNFPPEKELVLTGRNPPEHFRDAADYISEIRNVKHPFERGVQAREGIEY